MSVEAPNNIKFSQPTTAPAPVNHRDSKLFESVFKDQQSLFSQRTDYQPKSPKQNIMWLEYNQGTHQDSDHAMYQLSSKNKPALLKFSNAKSPVLNSLFNGINQQKNIQHLIVRHSNFHYQHSQQIGRLLQLNDGIAWLVLDHNKIDDRGIRHIAKGLETNDSVVHAILADNNFGDDGAKALANTLKRNQSLQSLFIQGNSISDGGITAIMNALPHAKKLKIIDVRDNNFSAQTKKQLQNVCNDNGIRCYS